MLENLHLETFSQHLNSKFSIRREPGDTVALQLIEAKKLGSNPELEQFSLLFLGPSEAFLQQSIYRFEHDQIGSFEMFIVPIKKVEAGFQYEAIINRPL